MPTCRRKRVVLTEPPEALLNALHSDPNRLVYYLDQTGEIFESYEAYAARMSFYRLKQFQCEVTGRSGLDYFGAVESEQLEARTMHSRFSEPLKPAILRAVQWQVMGRLDHLVEAVYERFKDRYYPDERVIIDASGTKYHAMITKVRPPITLTTNHPVERAGGPSESMTSKENVPIHNIGGDLKIPVKDASAQDDPNQYLYVVKIMELERSNERSKSAAKIQVPPNELLTGTFAEVPCSVMSRDRLAFSKSILRRFIRDCVDREPAVASPWTVKPVIAERYGVDSVMPEETRKGVENIKKGEMDKRKKIWEEKEGPPNKKQKKLTPAQEERAKVVAAATEKREREAQEKAEKQRAAKEEAERLAAEKKKKKPIRYPTEDLDVRVPDKEKKAGVKVQRPVPSRDLPFDNTPGAFESFLMTWNFLIAYGQPLHLSTFTLDEFEHALRHSLSEPRCALLAEIHSTLIYNLRTVPFQRHSAIRSMMYSESSNGAEAPLGVDFQQLSTALSDVGNNWERVPLRLSEGREGWEEALVGCLKDHATLESFPELRRVLTQLLFAPEAPEEQSSAGSRGSSPPTNTPVLSVLSKPTDRYAALPPADRIATLTFMCNVAISSKAIHSHMETCEEQLTALRKEKIEVNRLKKQHTEEINSLSGEAKTEENSATGEANGAGEGIAVEDSSDLSDISPSEGGSETPSTTSAREKKSARQKELRLKAQSQALAKQRQLARAKIASAKQAQAEQRRLEEEVNKLDRRLEGIEREFRKLLGAVRMKPMGKDRFYNRIWWFDGVGSASLLGSGGVVQYGAGRLFIQGPSDFDLDLLNRRKDEDIQARRLEEEGRDGMLSSGDWAAYIDMEEAEEFLAWLNPKGNRELALKNALTKWWPHIVPGIRKRIADLNVNAKLPEARRSARTKTGSGHDVAREPYMMWTNRKAVNAA